MGSQVLVPFRGSEDNPRRLKLMGDLGQGLREVAGYIKAQLERFKERARSNFRIEIEENVVGGSFNMMFLGHGLSTPTFVVPMSPKKDLRAVMLKRRFADTTPYCNAKTSFCRHYSKSSEEGTIGSCKVLFWLLTTKRKGKD
ncbi:uncharacterized protein [Gossypium hirsutum]|uniref:Uncharacterized protein isoform X1 n=3 Tax=Gossypium TaxID=3633 RepID=A0A1U8LZ84_GOSHI|nr:uncharacterized protein LOC107931255 isoform X1 [Gossypium hirsutum]